MNIDRETGYLGSETPKRDVIRGWEIRNHDYNSVATNGLSPFVQLIGLYSEEEIGRLIQKDPDINTRQVTYVNDNDQVWDDTKAFGGYEAEINLDEQLNYFDNEIRDKYIQINIQNYNQKDDNAITPGIVLASNVSQVGNDAFETYDNNLPKDSGGIGITDLQIETGTKDFMNRRYKLRMTVTDPFILNDSKEYLKLSTLQSQFLLIHGWSNPHQIDGMDEFDPPPKIDENKHMTVDLTNANTGGMWSAATVAITMFDFAFNETGQLEASFTFMPREISFAATYRIDLVAPTTKLFLGTGEESTTKTEQEEGVDIQQNNFDFAGLVAGFGSVAGEFGKNLAQIIEEEQQAYFTNNASVASLFTNMDLNFDAADTLRNFSENISQWSQSSGDINLNVLMENQKRAEGRNSFPYAGPGIRVYSEKKYDSLVDPTNPDSETVSKVQRNSHIQYYYLGWLMEAIRFSMWDLNKDRVKNGQTPFDLKFKYYKIPEDSQFNLAFQDELFAGTRQHLKDLVPDFIANAKLNNLPRDRRWDPVGMELFAHYATGGDFSGPVCPNSVDAEWQAENISVTPISAEDIEGRWAIYFGELAPFGVGNYPLYTILDGNTSEDVFSEWHNLTRREKFEILREKSNGGSMEHEFIPEGEGVRIKTVVNPDTNEEEYVADYRKCLFRVGPSDPAYDPSNILVRIMHPDFDGQLLYNWTWKQGKYIWIDPTDERDEKSCGAYVSAGNGPAGAGRPGNTYVYSKLNNFFIGEVLTNTVWMRNKDTSNSWWNPFDSTGGTRGIKWVMSDTEWNPPYLTKPGLGIIMPAVSARYYSPGLYLDAQHKWYHMHINFLRSEIERLIREKLFNGESISTQSIINGDVSNAIYHHPIDLKYLTGRIYDHNLPYFFYDGETAQSAGQGGHKPNWDMSESYNKGGTFQSRARPYSLQEYNVDNIIYGGDENIITRQKEDTLRSNRERQATRLRGLNGTGTNLDYDRYYQMSLSRLNNMKLNEERYTNDQIFSQSVVVANIIKEKQGQSGVATFWEGQLNDIMVKFYNKDLIYMDSSSITVSPDSLYTIAGNNTLPLNFDNLGWKEALNKWTSANPQQYREPLGDYQERAVNGTLLLYPDSFDYQVENQRRAAGKPIVQSSQETESDVRKTIQELWSINGIEANPNKRNIIIESSATEFYNIAQDGYYFVFYRGSEEVNTPEYNISFKEWREDKINFAKNQVGPTYGRYLFTNYDNTKKYDILNINNVDSLGELDLNSKTGMNYIFLNFLSENDRNRWCTGEAISNAADNGDASAAMIIRYAQSSYNNFVRRNRSLASYYISQYAVAQDAVDSLTHYEQFSLEQIEETERDLNNTNAIIRSLNNREALSPFTPPNSSLDTVFNWDRGGGRYMAIDGVVAQQWAVRFDNRTRLGATDIENYNPPAGGLAIQNMNSNTWGWAVPSAVRSNAPKYNDNGVKPGAAQLLNSYIEPAVFDHSNLPKSILDIEKLSDPNGRYRYDGKTYWIRGSRPYDPTQGQPAAIIANYGDNDENILFFANAEENFETNSLSEAVGVGDDMEIKHLVRAGVVNVQLIKDILSNNTNYSHMDFKLDGEESDAAYTISGKWPFLYNHWESDIQIFRGQDDTPFVNSNTNSYIGPAHLVDKDLDFVAMVMDFFPIPENYSVSSEIDLGNTSYAGGDGLPGVVRYRYDSSKSLSIWETTSGRMDEYQWVEINLVATDYIKLNVKILKYFRTMGHGASRSFITNIGGGGSFLSTDTYTVYPNQGAITRTENKKRVNVLRDNDHLPNIPFNLTEKMVNKALYGDIGFGASFISSGRPATTKKQPYGKYSSAGNEQVESDASDPIVQNGASPINYARGRSWPANSTRATSGVCINDILNTLPDDFQKGFFSSVGFANVEFGGGSPLNSGLIKYFVESFINLFSNGRRIADTKVGGEANRKSNLMRTDVKFGDLLGDDFEKDNLHTGMANFSNQKIKSVAEIPIKRTVVDNLLSKKHANMSLLQFFQQILTPSAVGLAGNVQLGVRNVNGVIDIIPASISYKQQTTDFFKEQLDKSIGGDVKLNHLLFEYKKRNSLVENIDMSSKMDPAAFLTYQNSSDLLLGRDYNVLKLLSYEGVAEDFKEFLDGTQRVDDSGQTYSGIITIGTDKRIKVDKTRFKELPSSIVDSMIAQNPERWAKITAMMQGNNNFTTELLAFYMRSVTLTIHGTTNLQPFNLINVSGVMPDLEGIYIITNLTEKVTPTTFQTIIEGKLLKRKRLSDNAYI